MSATERRARTLALIEQLSDDGDGAGRVTPETRLGDVGFDSLALAELAAAVEPDLGIDLSRSVLGEDDRVEDLLRAVERAGARATPVGLAPGTGLLQGPADLIGGWALRRWFGLRVVGADRLPRAGPAVLAMNHESALDIPIVVVACPRRIVFMAKKELFKNAVVSWALRALGGFRVDRDLFDLPAVDAALAAITRGDVLGMYPEGTRSRGELLPFLHGAAWVALRTGAPMFPCSIRGTERARDATRPGRVRVRVEFHETIPVERVDDRRERRRLAAELTERLRTAVASGLG